MGFHATFVPGREKYAFMSVEGRELGRGLYPYVNADRPVVCVEKDT